jgi:hypothetical protein
MKYTKPQVTLLASATDAIQSDTMKPFQHVVDNAITQTKGTSAAYEADE